MTLVTLLACENWISTSTTIFTLRLSVRHPYIKLKIQISGGALTVKPLLEFRTTMSIIPWIWEVTITCFFPLCLLRPFLKILHFIFVKESLNGECPFLYKNDIITSLATILDTPETNFLIFSLGSTTIVGVYLDNYVNFKQYPFTLIFPWLRLMNSSTFSYFISRVRS